MWSRIRWNCYGMKNELPVSFNHIYRYMDDVLSIKNHNVHNHVHLMYPDEFKINDTSESDSPASYLSISLDIKSYGRLTTILYKKCDDFHVAIVNFPFLLISKRRIISLMHSSSLLPIWLNFMALFGFFSVLLHISHFFPPGFPTFSV
jgi:hypothetical protein